jgi:UPF0271 protein
MKLSQIHINCDLGEGVPNEAAMFPYINACSLACGGHFGSKETLAKSMQQALTHRVVCGAHPSYPDKTHFGRQSKAMKKEAFIASMREQLNLFKSVFDLYYPHEPIPHIKAHGALYNDLCKQEALAKWFLEAIYIFDFKAIFTPANGLLYEMAKAAGHQVVREVFLDRAYTPEGFLMPRSEKGSVLSDPTEVLNQLKELQLKGADSFCIHGDHAHSEHLLKTIRTV